MANGNVYQMVTDRIIAELEKGIIPWKKNWSGSNKGAFNRISKKPYSLMNQILLGKSGGVSVKVKRLHLLHSGSYNHMRKLMQMVKQR